MESVGDAVTVVVPVAVGDVLVVGEGVPDADAPVEKVGDSDDVYDGDRVVLAVRVAVGDAAAVALNDPEAVPKAVGVDEGDVLAEAVGEGVHDADAAADTVGVNVADALALAETVVVTEDAGDVLVVADGDAVPDGDAPVEKLADPDEVYDVETVVLAVTVDVNVADALALAVTEAMGVAVSVTVVDPDTDPVALGSVQTVDPAWAVVPTAHGVHTVAAEVFEKVSWGHAWARTRRHTQQHYARFHPLHLHNGPNTQGWGGLAVHVQTKRICL